MEMLNCGALKLTDFYASTNLNGNLSQIGFISPFAPQNCHIINDFVLFGSDGLSLLYLWAGSCANDVQTKSVLALNKKLKMNLKFQFFI